MATLQTDPDIAIIGMSCRVAGANSTSELWDLLESARDVQSEITRFNARGYYHPKGGPLKGLTNVKDAYMLDDNLVDRFDHTFFRITPQEAAAIDPQQRMLLELAYEAIENAGVILDDFIGSDTAVYAGIEGTDYHTILARDIDATPKYFATGTPTCMAANRISYFFDLSGPSLTVDSACSSSMSALHLARSALQRNESKMALVCGAKLILNPDMFMPSSELGFLGPSGRCKTFDAEADGYGRGEGIIALLVRPLQDALKSNDPIRAVIRGTRLNSDGRTQGITLPSASAQANNMRSLYGELGIAPDEIQYFEAHGTGTAAGDPIEASAINTVFRSSKRSQDLIVGSVKPNVGHVEASSALAGIVKTVEALERGKIPPQMHLNRPNPKIDFSHLIVPKHLLDWPGPKDGTRMAAVNSFGAGGTNGHAILQAHSSLQPDDFSSSHRPLLFKLCANNEKGLEEMRTRLAQYVQQKPPKLENLAFTLLSRRSMMSRNAFFIAETIDQLFEVLSKPSPKVFGKSLFADSPVLFVFTGQGAQWPGMGKELLAGSDLFKSTVEECEQVLRNLPDGPTWSAAEEIARPTHTSNIYKSAFSQPLCTILQIGLVHIFRYWGLKPEAVVGHSSGEIAAAYAAGMLTLRDAVITAYYRGVCLSDLSSRTNGHRLYGSMCAIGLGKHDAETIISSYSGQVQLAAVNSPTSSTLSGDAEAIKQIIQMSKDEGIFCRELRVDTAFHSHHVISVATKYEQALLDSGVSFSEPTSCPMFSSVEGIRVSSEDITPAYWRKNMVHTVLFAPALIECLRSFNEKPICVEIGPHPALKGPSQETARSIDIDLTGYFGTCYRGRPAFESILESIAELLAMGMKLKTENINISAELSRIEPKQRVITDLPPYPWDHSTSFWYETGISKSVRFRHHPRHLLLGSRSIDDSEAAPCWRNHLRLDEVTFLEAEAHERTPLDPGYAVFIAMAAEAARQLQADYGDSKAPWQVNSTSFTQAIDLLDLRDSSSVIPLHFNTRKPDDSKTFDFEVLSPKSPQKKSCQGAISLSIAPTEHEDHFPHITHNPDLLQVAEKIGWRVSPALKEVKIGEQGVTGHFEISGNLWQSALDVEIIDAVLSLSLFATCRSHLRANYKLTAIDQIMLQTPGTNAANGTFNTWMKQIHVSGSKSDIDIYFGDHVLILRGLTMEVDSLIKTPFPFGALFSCPSTKPDIGSTEHLGDCSLRELLLLVTHKWPMADIGISGFSQPETVLDNVLDALGEQRTPFRTIQVEHGVPLSSKNVKVRTVDHFAPTVQMHLILLGPQAQYDITEVQSHLHPRGIICAPSEAFASEGEDILDNLGTVLHVDSQLLSVHRPAPAKEMETNVKNAVVFVDRSMSMALRSSFGDAQIVELEPDSVKQFCRHERQNDYTVVIVESAEQSIINTWRGKDIIPWLQHIMWRASSVIWVSLTSSPTPFHKFAGILLRTLQAERPSLRVSWLVSGIDDSPEVLKRKILYVYRDLCDEGNEAKTEWQNDSPAIIRYRLDDELCVMVGLSPPMIIEKPISSLGYNTVLVSKGSARVSSAAGPKASSRSELDVTVDASVVDIFDILAFRGLVDPFQHEKLGSFFAGRITGTASHFKAGAHVVGWNDTAHSGLLRVDENHLYPIADDIQPRNAAAVFAALAVSVATMDGIARIRQGDVVKIDISGLLGDILEQTVTNLGATFVGKDDFKKVDFHVWVCDTQGLLCNDRVVQRKDVEVYLCSTRGAETLSRQWANAQNVQAFVNEFSISQLQRALGVPIQEAFSTVLVHQRSEESVQHFFRYEKHENLLSAVGIYVIIGGLGGLGRFVCSWMVQNGAKNLVVMSRSGTKSPEAEAAAAELIDSGANLKVLKVDACDKEAVAAAFAGVRQHGRINGVLNMAMILADNSMAHMTGEQWDTALRVKVDSSWILHEETLQDKLDFFLLFSSIASVLGNRNQGSYNVGNAFLNGLAEYRHSLGLPAVSIGLGAMTEIGVLHELGKANLLQHLSRAGLTALTRHDLSKILEAAIIESPLQERPIIIPGLELFDRVNGNVVGSQDQTILYWTELPEFGHLQNHVLVDEASASKSGAELTIRERLQATSGARESEYDVLLEGFLQFLAKLQGFDQSAFEPAAALSNYGFDSLSAVSCQFWFHRELGIDVQAGDILNAKSIAELVQEACERLNKT